MPRKPKKSKKGINNEGSTIVVQIAVIGTMILVTIVLSLFFFSPSVLGFSEYLYHESEDDSRPIIDYVITRVGDKGKLDPDFIVKENMGPRVVEFYAPWCGHCVHFRPDYIDLARRAQNHPTGKNIQFHAISCTVHNKICNHFKIKGYPSLFALPAGATVLGDSLDRRKVHKLQYIFEMLGLEDGNASGLIRGGKGGKDDPEEEKDEGEEKDDEEKSPTIDDNSSNEDEEEEDSIAKFEIHPQSNIYSDAATSFQFALHTSIYMHNGPLSSEQSKIFQQWIDLLSKTIPSSSTATNTGMDNTSKQLKLLRQNIKAATSGKTKMLELLGIKSKRDDEFMSSAEWSTCRKEKEHGYTCGLWDLFHIMTVGFAENHDYDGLLPAKDASKLLRDYIENFFGCRECRSNFKREYDSCKYDVCHRFENDSDDEKDEDTPQELDKNSELALWLWEVHNGVNVRLLKEKYEREDKDPPSVEEEEMVLWPSREMCSECWIDDEEGSGWDDVAVYQFLKLTYWPKDYKVPIDSTIKQSSLERINTTTKTKRINPKISALTPLYLVLMLAFLWHMVQKREKDRIGRAKKIDPSSIHDLDKLII